MKNKTIKLVSLLVIMIVLTSQAVFAASEKPYTVELKNGFEEVADGVYASDGNGLVLIYETDADGIDKNEDILYSNEYLDAIASGMQEVFFTRDIKKAVLLLLNLDGINEENVDEIVDSMDMQIKKKEVTTFTKNNYKCLHFVIGVSVDGEAAFDEELYATVKGDKEYAILSISEVGGNKAINELINSFTFVETEEPKTEEPKSEEVKEDSKTEEPKSEEVKEEPKAEENKSEVKEETKQEEAKSEVKEETKKEETKTETKDTTVKEGKLPQTGVAVSFEAIAISILSLGTALFVINNKRK